MMHEFLHCLLRILSANTLGSQATSFDPFGIIFVDLELPAYHPILQSILSQRLLTHHDFIAVEKGK